MRKLMGLAALAIAGCGYTPGPEVKETKESIAAIAAAIKTYKTDVGKFPAKLSMLTDKPDAKAVEAKKWKGPYMKDLPKDAWGRDFVYNYPGKAGATFDLISLGEDGKWGGKKDAQDLADNPRSIAVQPK